MGRLIGIDLGTTTTVAAVAQAQPQVIINELGSRKTPSIVGFTEKGDRLIGEFAKRQLMAEPRRTIHSVRRFLGRRYDEVWEDMRRVPYAVTRSADGGVAIEVDNQLHTPEELVAYVLHAIKKSAEEVLGESISGAVITAPVSFTARQRDALRDAGALAGLQVLRIINEPTAAALAWVSNNRRAGTLAVYDFGGACFDLSIVRADETGVRVLASATQTRLGGWDLDLRIIQWLIEEFFTQHLIDVSTEAQAMQRLRDAAERAKLELSSASETEIRLPFLTADDTGPKHIQKTLTRVNFHSMVEDLLDRSLVDFEALLDAANLNRSDLDDVILVGGSSRIPGLQEMVSARVGAVEDDEALNPDEVIAIGAAIQAHLLTAQPADPSKPALSMAIGVEDDHGGFRELIPRGTTLPSRARWDITPSKRAHDESVLRIAQGNSSRMVDNIVLGDISLENFEFSRDRPLQLSLNISEASGLDATLMSQDGQKRSLSVPTLAGITCPAGADAEPVLLTEADDSAEAKEARRMRDVLARHLTNLERLRSEHQDRLTAMERADLDAALKRGRVAVLKTSERPAYFQEMTNYIFHFYTNLTAKLGV